MSALKCHFARVLLGLAGIALAVGGVSGRAQEPAVGAADGPAAPPAAAAPRVNVATNR